MKRVKEYVINLVANGAVGMTAYLFLKFLFLYFSPANWYFYYDSVEPVTNPSYISDEYIEMRSTLRVNLTGNIIWNDVLRCIDGGGQFSYVGQSDTSAANIKTSDGFYESIWKYRGEMPDSKNICRMDSTITRELPYGITKKQFVQSSIFVVE